MKRYPEVLLSSDAFPMVWGRFEASMGVAKKPPILQAAYLFEGVEGIPGVF